MLYHVVLSVPTANGWENKVVYVCSSLADAADWGFTRLPSRPTDPPWRIFREDGLPLRLPTTVNVLPIS